MREDLNNLKVGDIIYSLIHGWGQLVEINEESHYPLVLDYPSGLTTFTKTGKSHDSHNNQVLFTYDPFEFPTWLHVNNNDKKVLRYCIFKSNYGTLLTFPNESMDLSQGLWLYEWKELEFTEMTVKEIEEKLGINNLKIVE